MAVTLLLERCGEAAALPLLLQGHSRGSGRVCMVGIPTCLGRVGVVGVV